MFEAKIGQDIQNIKLENIDLLKNYRKLIFRSYINSFRRDVNLELRSYSFVRTVPIHVHK